IVTDSKETMEQRSLTRYFPEILAIELRRYPEPEQLDSAAAAAGLTLIERQNAAGDISLSDEFVARLDAQCSSAMGLLPPDVHAAGMARVRAAQREGAVWRSCYLVLAYRRK